MAVLQQNTMIKLEPARGSIYDANNHILALDFDTYSIYAVPRRIQDKIKMAGILSTALSLNKGFLIERLDRKNSFIWLKRKISDKEAEFIKKLNLNNIGLVVEKKRFYPKNELGCHYIGFVDIDNNGLEGLELTYDRYLKGKYGWESTLRDARQIPLHSYGERLDPVDGYNLVLTADEVIQHTVEEEIKNIVKNCRPKGVMIIAMRPDAGEILAMANYPAYNPNTYQSANPESFKNKAIADAFEPGSVFKIVTASAVLDQGLVNFDDKFYCENGNYKVGKRILHDYKPYGTLSFREVIEKSSNIGTVKAAEKLGKDKMFAYIKKFGFGSRSGIDMPGEENGIIRDVSTWTPSDMTTIPMGQGISCTALQLAQAVSVIANGGMLMRPYVTREITSNDLSLTRKYEPLEIRRVISEETASKMRNLLSGVVECGTGTKARLDNYKAGGKTGTAQKVGKDGKYAKGKYVASFVGFAPVDKPRVVLVVCIDEPKGEYFGGRIAAPVFKNIMQKVLQYLEA